MNIKQSIIALSVVSLLGAGPLQAGGRSGNANGGNQSSPGASAVIQPLSEDEAASLRFMREEEKLARDVYITAYEQWKHPVFSNISRAEQRHMDTMLNQLEANDLLDPVSENTVGVFQNAELQALYTDLEAMAAVSLYDALLTGAFIEETDIKDLREAIAATDDRALLQAYENLLRGSRNHLRAFVGQLEQLGDAYDAQVLDQADVNMIVDQPMERGRGGRRDRGGRG